MQVCLRISPGLERDLVVTLATFGPQIDAMHLEAAAGVQRVFTSGRLVLSSPVEGMALGGGGGGEGVLSL